MDKTRAIRLASAFLSALADTGELYAACIAAEEITDDEYNEMLDILHEEVGDGAYRQQFGRDDVLNLASEQGLIISEDEILDVMGRLQEAYERMGGVDEDTLETMLEPYHLRRYRMRRGGVGIELVHAGEGYGGEYQFEDNLDEPLIRINVYREKKINFGGDSFDTMVGVEGGSFCTNIPITISDEQRQLLLRFLTDVILLDKDGNASKPLINWLSYLTMDKVEEAMAEGGPVR